MVGSSSRLLAPLPYMGVDHTRFAKIRGWFAQRDGASINAAANASGINYRTAQRIVRAAAAAEHRQRQLMAVG
jgi:hypothetical protein